MSQQIKRPKPVEAVMSTNSVMCMNTIQQLADNKIILLQTIAFGTYGKVKQATFCNEQGETITVAVKIIDRRRASPTYVRSFLPREVQIVSMLKHPNVVNTLTVLDIDKTNVCIVSEYCANGNLLAMIKRLKQIPDNLARGYFRHLFEALFYLHERLQVIHRDIKCENILFDDWWNVKLTDFGFARRMDPNGPPSSNFCGSKAYSAPEILAHDPYTGFSSDIWSAGIVLYISLTGLMPYNDKSGDDQLRRQRQRIIDYHHRDVNEDAKSLIYDLLNPDPQFRPKYDDIVSSAWLCNTPWEFRHGSKTYRCNKSVRSPPKECVKTERPNEGTPKSIRPIGEGHLECTTPHET